MASSGDDPPDPSGNGRWNFKFNPFKVLGISSDDPEPDEVIKAYRTQIRIHHTDKGGNGGLATKLTTCYNFLKNRDAEKLKELAQQLRGSGAAIGNDGVDLSHVLVDKTKAEHYRRLFEAHVKVAQDTKFKDNFKEFYKSVFAEVSTQPEVKSEYHCHLCNDDFIDAGHHVELFYPSYLEYLYEDAQPGYKEFLEKVFGHEVVNWMPPLDGQGTDEWGGGKFLLSFNRWCELLKPLKDDEKWMTKMEKLGRSQGEDAMLLLTCLFSAVGQSEQDLCAAVLKALPPIKKEGKILDAELILPAFLHVIKDFKNWHSLSKQMAPISPRIALILAHTNTTINPNIEDNYYQLGEAIIKSQKDFGYAHLCFLLGSCDLNFAAHKMLSFSSHIECKQLAAYYFAKTNDAKQLEKLVETALENKNLDTAAVYSLALFRHEFFIKQDKDNGIRALASILPNKKYWQFIQAVVMDFPDLALQSEAVAEAILLKIVREFKDMDSSVLNMIFDALIGRKQISSIPPGLISALSGSLHILYNDERRYTRAKELIMTILERQLDMKLMEANVEFILELSKIPEILPLMKKILEKKQFLGHKAAKAQPGSNYYTCLLILRGVYHYKSKHFGEMVQDFASAAMHTTSSEIHDSIASFITRNPMIHEKIIKQQSIQFQQLEAYIDNYSGEPLDSANFLQVLQNTFANEEPHLSAVFSISSSRNEGPDLIALEKDILGRNDDNMDNDSDSDDDDKQRIKTQDPLAISADYAEKAYNYVNLEVICKGLTETVCCLTMAASYFLKAMLATPENDIPQKFGYRGLILECSRQLKDYVNIFMLPVPLALHSLRTHLSFIFQANQHFSDVLQKNNQHNGMFQFIGEEDVPVQADDWQKLLNLRTICPIVIPDIYTIAEGRFALQFVQRLYNSLLLAKIDCDLYSSNTPSFMYHHMLFNGVWSRGLSPENTGYEDEIPDTKHLDAKIEVIHENDNEEEKARKHKVNEEIQAERHRIEETRRLLEEMPLVERVGFRTARENAMIKLGELYNYSIDDVEDMMKWHLIRRTPEGFIDMSNTTLNFDGEQAYSKFLGIKMNPNTKTCEFLLEPAVPGDSNRPALFSSVDLMEIFGNKICAAVLSFDEQLYPPNIPDYLKLLIPFHPFYKVRFTGIRPDGANKESICGTNFLMTLYHLDLLAKIFTTGQEIGANFPFSFKDTENNLLSGLSKELQNVLKPIGPRKKVKFLRELELIHRFWFEIEDVEQEVIQGSQQNSGTSTIKYGNATVVLKTMQMMRGKSGELEDAEHLFDEESPEANFVRGFNEKNHLIEKEFPIIQRIKELAKISQCFGILHSNKESLEKDIPAFKNLMEFQLPSTRPYSQCGGNGHVCQCCDWVPAVYHQMKVTMDQKMEYLFEKFSMGTPENAVEEGERIKRLLFHESQNQGDSSSTSTSGTENSSGSTNKRANQKASSLDMEKYDRLEIYRCYGGVNFNPNSIVARGIPSSPYQRTVPTSTVLNAARSSRSAGKRGGGGGGDDGDGGDKKNRRVKRKDRNKKGERWDNRRKKGPSGEWMEHFKVYPSRKAAYEAARRAGQGKPVEDGAHGPGQRAHFHPTDRYGNRIKDGSHYEYGKPNSAAK